MGQANICGARGAAATQAQPGAPGPVAPGARRGLWRRAASRPPPPLGTFVSSGSPQLLLTLPAQVTRHQRTRQRHLLLFPHAVAIASFKCGSIFWLKHRVRLSELWVLCSEEAAAARPEEEEEEVFGLKCSRTLILVWPTNLCVVTFGSQEAKQLWLDTMLRQSPGAPGARLTRLPSLRLLTKVIGFYGPEMSLTAATVETLISVEADAKKGPRLDPSDGEEALGHSAAEGAKARRQVISWPLARRGTPASRACPVPGQLASGPRAALFGQPLAALCGQDGGLPQPVQELLAILYEKGPATEGIFRKAASEKARKELKEVLNQGKSADLDSRPVHLLAVVLKDFLRDIPSKLLADSLYEEWMQALEKPSQQDKIDKLKEVADSLPTANLLLLQRLLAVLRHISENVETSKMDTSNLAICVGPNMLSPCTDNVLTLAELKERNDKVTALVAFLIDNCRAIFGEDITLPFSPSAQESPEHTNSSTGQPGAPQHDGSACNSAEPQAEGSTPVLELEQPKGRSSSLRRPYPTCVSAPSLSNFTSGISSMDRCFSEPDLSCHDRLEGWAREQEASEREGKLPGQQ